MSLSQKPDRSDKVFASFIDGQLLTPRQDVQYVPNAGLLIHQVGADDAGLYSVHVNLHHDDDTHTHTADVTVATAPGTSDGRLHVQTRPGAVVDNHTGQWSAELECGHFTSLGQPPVTVQWTVPSGHILNSSYYANGTFVLTLTEPAESGNYSCQLSRESPAAMCVPDYDPLAEKASLYVDDKDIKLAVLEARQKELEAQNLRLRHDVETLTNQTRHCNAENGELEVKVQHLTNETHVCNAQKAELYQVCEANYTRLTNETEVCEAEKKNLVQSLRYSETCLDVKQYDNTSGIHILHPQGHSPITVYCDQSTDGGGWTVFQRRQDGSVDFYRKWTEYQRGFGDLQGEFWLGLDNLHTLTSAKRQELRVDLTDWEGNSTYATYSGFRIANSSDNYRLHFDSFTGGDAGDSLSHQKGHQFSTPDADHDTYSSSCAVKYHGAWWYHICHLSNLNGEYKHSGSAPGHDGLNWRTFRGDYYSMKFTEMKIRPM